MTKVLYIPNSSFLWFISDNMHVNVQDIENSNIYFMPFEKDEDLINLLMLYYNKCSMMDISQLVKEELEVIHD